MASNAGVSGLIVPDLPLEEAYKFSKIVSNNSMDLILLVAPTTPFESNETNIKSYKRLYLFSKCYRCHW